MLTKPRLIEHDLRVFKKMFNSKYDVFVSEVNCLNTVTYQELSFSITHNLSGIFTDKTMDDKLKYIPDNGKQN